MKKLIISILLFCGCSQHPTCCRIYGYDAESAKLIEDYSLTQKGMINIEVVSSKEIDIKSKLIIKKWKICMCILLEKLKQRKKNMRIKLWYFIENLGDGSVAARFYKTEKEAKRGEQLAFENGGEGWGEPSIGSLELHIDENGTILNSNFLDIYYELNV